MVQADLLEPDSESGDVVFLDPSGNLELTPPLYLGLFTIFNNGGVGDPDETIDHWA